MPLLIGKDSSVSVMWQYLYRGVYWPSLGSHDGHLGGGTALWDVKGTGRRAAGVPAPRRTSRDGVMVYSHASGTDTPSLLDDVARFLDLGYKAVRAQAAVRHRQLYSAQGQDLEPAAASLPEVRALVDRGLPGFRPPTSRPSGTGSGSASTSCTTCTLTPNEAAQFGKQVEPYRCWMEDPTPAENQEAFRHIRRHTTTPIAVGEALNSIWDVQHLITRD